MRESNNHFRLKAGKFLTIREVARTGLISEYNLRLRVAARTVPFIRTGNRVLINYPRLIEQLDQESLNIMEGKIWTNTKD